MKLRHHLNFAMDILIQPCQVIRGNPVFAVNRASNDMDVVLTEKLRGHPESQTYPANPERSSLVFHSRAICVAYSSVNTG